MSQDFVTSQNSLGSDSPIDPPKPNLANQKWQQVHPKCEHGKEIIEKERSQNIELVPYFKEA